MGPILGCLKVNVVPPTASFYNDKNIPIVKINNYTDYTLEVIITDPMIYKGGVVPAKRSATVSILAGPQITGSVTVKVIATKDGHLVGDWEETFPVPKSSANFIPIRNLKPEHFK